MRGEKGRNVRLKRHRNWGGKEGVFPGLMLASEGFVEGCSKEGKNSRG